MIEFSGELCYECKNYIYKKAVRALFIKVFVVIAALSTILFVLAFVSEDHSVFAVTISLTAIVAVAGLSIFFREKRAVRLRIPDKIVIQNGVIYIEREIFNSRPKAESNKSVYAGGAGFSLKNKVGLSTGLKRSSSLDVSGKSSTEDDILSGGKHHGARQISNIKKIVDMGKWYQIIFYGQKSAYYACQKDLIVKGTIIEFIMLFEGKIKSR